VKSAFLIDEGSLEIVRIRPKSKGFSADIQRENIFENEWYRLAILPETRSLVQSDAARRMLKYARS
jgi:hypothetical protein